MTSLLIATPCYGGQVYASCANCIMELRILLLSQDVHSEWFTISGESLIPRARNAIVAYFLSTAHTHLLFVDSDIVFDPTTVTSLLKMNVPISACSYPKKEIDLQSLVEKARMSNADADSLILSSMSYVLGTSTSSKMKDGWIKVDEVGTGFLLLKKEVLEQLIFLHPELKYENDCLYYNELHPDMANNFYLFFDTRLIDGRYLSEDYSFCRYVRDAGYEIHVDTKCGLNHIGSYTYRGNLYLSLRSQI